MFGRLIALAYLVAIAVGCDRRQSAAVEAVAVTVTNVVTVTREVVVTNVVTATETVTNVVEEVREPARILSLRKTAPYLVAAGGIDEGQLRKLASDAAARVIECREGVVSLVEASDKAAKLLSETVTVVPLNPEMKIAADAGEEVRILPVSTIDVAPLSAAVKALGGEVVQVVTTGSPVVRAKMDVKSILKLAGRGDVRRIERDGK